MANNLREDPAFNAQLTQTEDRYSLPSGLLRAIMLTESGGAPSARSPKGALGAFQFIPATAKRFGIDPLEPVQAAEGAGRYMRQLLDRFDNSLPVALASYNAGEGWSEAVLGGKKKRYPAETEAYVPRVLAFMPRVAEPPGWIARAGGLALSAVVPEAEAAAPGPAGAPPARAREAMASPLPTAPVPIQSLSRKEAIAEWEQLTGRTWVERAETQPQAAPLPLSTEGLSAPSRIPEFYGEALEESKAALRSPGFWPKAAGALLYAASPITAVSRGFIGEPAKQAAQSAGVPSRYAGMVGTAAELATPGLGLTRLPGAAARIAARKSAEALSGLKIKPAGPAPAIEQAAAETLAKGPKAWWFIRRLKPEATAERLELAALAEAKYGLKINPGDYTATKRVQGWEDTLERMGATDFIANRQHNIYVTNRLLSKRIGNESPQLTQGWFADTDRKIGETFKGLADQAGTINLDAVFYDHLKAIRVQAASTGSGGKIARIIASIKKSHGDSMTPANYAALRSEYSEVARSTASANHARRLRAVNGALDDALGRSLPTKESYAEARRQYREFRMLDDATDINGNVDTGKMHRQLRKSLRGQYRRLKPGDDELLDLVRIRETFKSSIPSSGTAERLQAQKEVGAIGGALSSPFGRGAAGFALGDITGMLGGIFGPDAAQKLLLSKRFRDQLIRHARAAQ